MEITKHKIGNHATYNHSKSGLFNKARPFEIRTIRNPTLKKSGFQMIPDFEGSDFGSLLYSKSDLDNSWDLEQCCKFWQFVANLAMFKVTLLLKFWFGYLSSLATFSSNFLATMISNASCIWKVKILNRYCMQMNCFQSQIASNGRLVTADFVRQNNDSNYDVTFASYPGTASLYAVIVSTR